MKCSETMETLIVMTEIFGRSPSSETKKNTHNVSEAGLTLSSGGKGKGENLKHKVSNQKGAWKRPGLSHEQSGLFHPIPQQW
jgi:hypothetical protein